MSKPLELSVYLPDDSGDYEHPVHGFWVTEEDADHYMEATRLTDAELAAEYWQAAGGSRIRVYQRDPKGNIVDIRGVGWEYERDVMARFATLPHYDEQP